MCFRDKQVSPGTVSSDCPQSVSRKATTGHTSSRLFTSRRAKVDLPTPLLPATATAGQSPCRAAATTSSAACVTIHMHTLSPGISLYCVSGSFQHDWRCTQKGHAVAVLRPSLWLSGSRCILSSMASSLHKLELSQPICLETGIAFVKPPAIRSKALFMTWHVHDRCSLDKVDSSCSCNMGLTVIQSKSTCSSVTAWYSHKSLPVHAC